MSNNDNPTSQNIAQNTSDDKQLHHKDTHDKLYDECSGSTLFRGSPKSQEQRWQGNVSSESDTTQAESSHGCLKRLSLFPNLTGHLQQRTFDCNQLPSQQLHRLTAD